MTTRHKIGLFGVPAAVIVIIVMLVVPLPSFLLDLLITVNISAALVVLLMTMHVDRARDFSGFPSLLLIATMFRLAINVSVTRLVLLHGYAGAVVQSFGSFVIGGQAVVGIVVFLILIIIQFVVVTSGAGRVSEVSARFSLDAMGPKLIAIDGELNTGLIDEKEARRRRKEIDETSEFYGNMDGASKFVRGDAIAALIITVINLFGGFLIGVLQRHLSMSQAVHTYSILSIGDGLVSQIPALLLSISTGLIVTRGANREDGDFGNDILDQFRAQPRTLQIAGAAMILLAIVPGLPHLPFFIVGCILILLSTRLRRSNEDLARRTTKAEEDAIVPVATDTPQALASEMRAERLELELAANVTPLADPAHGGDLLERVRGLRRKVALERGFAIPTVRTHDNINLPPNTYAIRVNGVEVARGEAHPARMLAIGPGIDLLNGIATTEPAFGLPAKWIPAETREHAIAVAGITPIDPSSAIITHLAEVVTQHASELLSVQQVQILLDAAKATDPAAIEEMKLAQVSLVELHRVLASLVEEGVPIIDFVRIVEAITGRSRQPNKSHEALVESARAALGPMISAAHARNGRLAAITIDAAFEQVLVYSVRVTDTGSILGVEPQVTELLVGETRSIYDAGTRSGREPVLVVGSVLRPALARLFAAAIPRLAVMSVNEIGRQVQLERIGVVTGVSATAGI
ncbi:MAG: flagellar biosynthesis protein FlhA [Acidimicrobiaceae bacterium]|jgi:flagellar biosynthesis protein FlhA|nr:flagellar biosynthesis protein FlhA [Acidimicrobiaceae bacterium]